MDSTVKTSKRNILKEKYPQNILILVQQELEKRGIDASWDVITEDICAGVDYAIDMLSDREKEMLRMRYIERKTQAKIGQVYGITKTAVGSTEAKAIYKLCRAPLLGYLKYGKNAYEDKCKRIEKEKQIGISDEARNTHISELEFSIRIENALIRAGYFTVKDIACLTEQQIFDIKNLGKKEYREIAYRLQALGVLGTQWKYFIY